MKANQIQVGGTHYRTSFQHWDMAAEHELGYYEGQITKYVTRHRFKKGKEDADKAAHFMQKLIELSNVGKAPMSAGMTSEQARKYGEANKLEAEETDVVFLICNWVTVSSLEYALKRWQAYTSVKYFEPDPAEASLGYVNQDHEGSTL